MKRFGNLFDKITDIENIRMAERKARRGKENNVGVKAFDKDAENNLLKLQKALKEGTFRTSNYFIFSIFEPKERIIYRLPYYPDRIVHHAIMNVLEPIFIRNFTRDTYQCIKGRGIHACAKQVKKALKYDFEGTQYALQIDIVKFYPSIVHSDLKRMLRRIIKDARVIALLDEIIDSTEGDTGLPIGNYVSQFFANFYLSQFDHWVKEVLRVKHYFRYADDIIILGATKGELHGILASIREELEKIGLSVKDNYQVYPVDKRPISYVGYRYTHTYTIMRKSIKQNLARKVAKLNRQGHRISEADYRQAISPWWGWAKHCNAKNLIKKLSKNSTYEIEFR